MPEELDQQIHHALTELDASSPAHDLPSDAEVWSRLQFRLAYRLRAAKFTAHTGALPAAVYVLALLVWVTWSRSLSAGLIAVLAIAAVVAGALCLRVSRMFRS
jgi:hypothetical protein